MKKGIKEGKRTKMNVFSVILFVVLILYTISLFVPFFWGLMSSFKDRFDFVLNPFGFPKKWMFSNYSNASEFFYTTVEDGAGYRKAYFGEMFLNSVVYSFFAAVLSTLMPMIVAYMTVRYPNKFSDALVMVNIAVMLLPIFGNTASGIQVSKTLGLYDSIWGQSIVAATWTGMPFMIFRAAFKSLPKDYAEAAEIDGASNFGVMRVMLPLARNTFFTFALLGFIGFWNNYQTPLLFMPNHPTVAYGLFSYANSSANSTSSAPMRLTGAMLVFLPVFVIFLIFHKRILGNITVGGLKG